MTYLSNDVDDASSVVWNKSLYFAAIWLLGFVYMVTGFSNFARSKFSDGSSANSVAFDSITKAKIVKITGSASWTKVTMRLRHECMAFLMIMLLNCWKVRAVPLFFLISLLNSSNINDSKLKIKLHTKSKCKKNILPRLSNSYPKGNFSVHFVQSKRQLNETILRKVPA